MRDLGRHLRLNHVQPHQDMEMMMCPNQEENPMTALAAQATDAGSTVIEIEPETDALTITVDDKAR